MLGTNALSELPLSVVITTETGVVAFTTANVTCVASGSSSVEGVAAFTLSSGVVGASGVPVSTGATAFTNQPATVSASGTGGAMSYRFWRAVGFDVSGSHLEISELQLFEGLVQATGATVTSSDVPGMSLGELVDDSLSTRAYWSEAVAEDSDFFIQFDFGDGNDKYIDNIKLGGYDTTNRYPNGLTLQYSDDGVSWTTFGSASELTYPGNNTLSEPITFTPPTPPPDPGPASPREKCSRAPRSDVGIPFNILGF